MTSEETAPQNIGQIDKVAFGSKISKIRKLLWYMDFRHFGVNIEVAKQLWSRFLTSQNELEAKINF